MQGDLWTRKVTLFGVTSAAKAKRKENEMKTLTKSKGRLDGGIKAKVMTMSRMIGMSIQQFRISLPSRRRDRLGTASMMIPSRTPVVPAVSSVILPCFRSILCFPPSFLCGIPEKAAGSGQALRKNSGYFSVTKRSPKVVMTKFTLVTVRYLFACLVHFLLTI